MVEINRQERTVKAKIVYYGPATGGKTTNLQVLHRLADPQRRGELVSVNSTQDRTILMDLLPMKTPAFRGFDLRFQVIAVPGQPNYAASRGLLLDAADSIVFVANSAADRWEETLQSFREMNKNLLEHGLDPATIPVVFQYNKQDLPELTPLNAMDRTLNARRSDSFPAVAVRGEGVLETFAAALKRTMVDLAKRHQLGQSIQNARSVEEWTKESLRVMFNQAGALAPQPKGGPPPGVKVQVKVAPTSRDEGTVLQESYATAAALLASELEEMRDQRDRAMRCLDELCAPVDAAQELLSGGAPGDVLERLVERIGRGLGAKHGELLLARPGGVLEGVVLVNLAADPFLSEPKAARSLASQPRAACVTAESSGPLLTVLDRIGGDCFALVAIPVKSPIRCLGLLCFFLTSDAPLPSENVLAHLSRLGQSLALALELSSGTFPSESWKPLDMPSVMQQVVPEAGRGSQGALAGR